MPSPIDRPIFGKIPALRLSAYLLGGIVIAHCFRVPLILSLSVLAGLLFSATLSAKMREAALIVAIVSAGASLHEARRPLAPPIINLTDSWVTLEGVIKSEPRTSQGSSQFELSVEGVCNDPEAWQPGGRISVRSGTTDLQYGDRVRATGLLRPPPQKKNPAQFDYGAYLERQGIFCTLDCTRGGYLTFVKSGSGGNPFMRRLVLPLRRLFRTSYSRTLSGESLAFVESITLGARENLSAETRTLFARTGVYHILAVSGLHVGIVGFILFTFLSALRFPRRPVTVMVIAVLILYMFITDLRPSVVRATIMAVVLLVGLSMERNVNLLNLLGVALLVILLVDPLSPFDLSFQLSFAATGAIILALERLRVHKRTFIQRWFCLPVIVSLAAQAGTAPIIAYHFFRLPLLTTVANLFVIPLATFSIGLSFTSSLTTLISLEISRLFAAANWLVIQGILKSVRMLGSFRHVDIITGRPSPQFLAMYFFLFSLALHMRWLWIRKAFLFTILIAGNLLVWQSCFASPKLSTTFLSLQGGACIVETPHGRTILIDCGTAPSSWERVVAPSLWEKGIRKIDLLLLTKPGSSRGAQSLLEDFDVGWLAGPPVPSGLQEHQQLLSQLRELQLGYVSVMAGDVIAVDGVELRFHYPTSNLMEFASVFELGYLDFKLLWWGQGVHGGSRLNLQRRYDAVWFGFPLSSRVATDLAVAEDSRHVLTPYEDLVITGDGAVEISSNGETFWAVQAPHRPDRATR